MIQRRLRRVERRMTDDEGRRAKVGRLFRRAFLGHRGSVLQGHLTWRTVWSSSLRVLRFIPMAPPARIACHPRHPLSTPCVSFAASSLHALRVTHGVLSPRALRVTRSTSPMRVACHPRHPLSTRVACHPKRLLLTHRVSSRAPGHPCPNTTVMSAKDLLRRLACLRRRSFALITVVYPL